jgi:hypothetical protein
MKKAIVLIATVSIVLSMFSVLAVHVRAMPNTYVCATILPSPSSGLSPLNSGPPPTYDEQLFLTFVQNFTVITYNVTANSQMDSNYYGPAYLVNGLSNTGYWYQAGLAYDWPYNVGGYVYGFNFVYDVFNPLGKSVFPSGGGGGLSSFNSSVSNGDQVILGLSFSGNNVTMSASDLTTGAHASQTYFGESASSFVGLTSSSTNLNGYFSGLMTEWYHALPYYGNEAQATYSEISSALTQAWMSMDEWEPGYNWAGAWSNGTSSPLQYGSNPNKLQEFSSHNATEYSDAYVFETGAPALCALKTTTGGGFYVPNPAYVNATSLRVEMLFTQSNITGDQTGAASPYPAIANYPDGKVSEADIVMVLTAFGSVEGGSNWNYMADILAERYVGIGDLVIVETNFGNTGSYSYNLGGVQVNFSTGASESPNAIGFVAIPPGATWFNVTQNGIAVGAMIVFCGS